jgi:hypothetical protein
MISKSVSNSCCNQCDHQHIPLVIHTSINNTLVCIINSLTCHQAITTNVASGQMRDEVRVVPLKYTTLFGLIFLAPKGMLEQAEQFKDDDVNVGQMVRIGVWEQFTRVLRELVDRFVKYSDLLDYDVTVLKSRFGLPLAVGFDCRRYLVRHTRLFFAYCVFVTLCAGPVDSVPPAAHMAAHHRRSGSPQRRQIHIYHPSVRAACQCVLPRKRLCNRMSCSFTVAPLWQPSLHAASSAVLVFLGMCGSVLWVLFRCEKQPPYMCVSLI